MTDIAPGYWMHETSGILRPAVYAYFADKAMTPEQVAAMRAYLRQWIEAPCWAGPFVDDLRQSIDDLVGPSDIKLWLSIAAEQGIDPL